jgi:hypothetical protein
MLVKVQRELCLSKMGIIGTNLAPNITKVSVLV